MNMGGRPQLTFNSFAFIMKQKMKYSKRLIAAAALIVALGVGAFGVCATLAAENGRGDMTTLVEAIAEKFDVKVADVQAVFDEHRAEMEANHEEREVEMLDKAVENGKLSQEQADLILEKRAEMKLFAEGRRRPTKGPMMGGHMMDQRAEQE